MKQLLKIKPRTKKPKPSAIENYKVSYLDKRSKTYHRVVMTSFAGLFGLAGLVYVFGAGAATEDSTSVKNNDNLLFIFIALGLAFLLVMLIYFMIRKK
jgi:hypothetical protein